MTSDADRPSGPIAVVDETGLAEVYADARSAEAALEPVDVECGIYTAYRSDGTILRVTIDANGVKIHEPVTTHREESALHQALALQAEWLLTRGLTLSAQPSELSNDALVDALLEYRNTNTPVRRVRRWVRAIVKPSGR